MPVYALLGQIGERICHTNEEFYGLYAFLVVVYKSGWNSSICGALGETKLLGVE